MRDPQKLIDDIHGFLGRSDQTLTDDVRGLVGELGELCVAADSRLRRCEDYLRRGLVGEAIHLAEVEPPVLDVVGALDFQGREQWEEVLNMYGLPVPPRVNLSRAAALNQAYELHQTLEPLLREYRRLCLSRSPPGERMAVLRELARNDPGNSSWNDDLALCESPALVELRQAFEKAVPRGDLVALAAVAQHLQGGAWSSPQAAGLTQQVLAELQALRGKQARKELATRSAALSRAMERDDLASVTNAYQPLFDVWQAAALPTEDPISQQLLQAAAWIQNAQQRFARQEEFDRQVMAFQTLLTSSKANEKSLEDGYAKLDRFGLPIPDAVKKGYRHAMKRYEQETNARARGWDRMMNLMLLCIALPVSLVVLAIMGVVLYRILRGP
jgi:hypothetical protein